MEYLIIFVEYLFILIIEFLARKKLTMVVTCVIEIDTSSYILIKMLENGKYYLQGALTNKIILVDDS